jgi:mono/diheme cytochrome c family protein
MIKRLLILLSMGVLGLGILMVFSYDVIKIDWISFMEIQPSYKAMDDPLPVPPNSIPAEGAAYIPGMGSPVNPVPSDKISLARGEQLFKINCVQCHGPLGMGDGVIGTFFQYKPANLTAPVVQNKSDGAIFLIVSTGVTGRMPPLNENLTVRDRWDLVNYVRTLKK